MKIIDTHTHIYAENFDDDIESVVQRAKDSGVEKILLPNVDTESLEGLDRLVSAYPGYCLPMMGLHPTNVDKDWERSLSLIHAQLCSNPRKYVAIGEIGIDLYWDKTFFEEQLKAFEQQLKWSIQYDLPVSIHTREAINETIECIKKVGSDNLRGVFHSFVGNRDELKAILALDNFLIGINGVITYKNSDLKQVLSDTDLSRIVIETDAPYLTPVPYRGKRNEPSYTQYIAQALADVYGVSTEEVGRITTDNAVRMFSL